MNAKIGRRVPFAPLYGAVLSAILFVSCSEPRAGFVATSTTAQPPIVAGIVGAGFVVTGATPIDVLRLPKSVGGVRGDDGVWTSVSIRLGDLIRGVSFTWDDAETPPKLVGADVRDLVLRPGLEADLYVLEPRVVWVQWTEGPYVLTVEGLGLSEEETIAIARRTQFDPSRTQEVD